MNRGRYELKCWFDWVRPCRTSQAEAGLYPINKILRDHRKKVKKTMKIPRER
uniref:Uncharacterized protein n=1 Tax=Romanomermis culicivorax TaxID=13658 RepID=A0A915KI99_ROMCU